jgi:hypothetical protein
MRYQDFRGGALFRETPRGPFNSMLSTPPSRDSRSSPLEAGSPERVRESIVGVYFNNFQGHIINQHNAHIRKPSAWTLTHGVTSLNARSQEAGPYMANRPKFVKWTTLMEYSEVVSKTRGLLGMAHVVAEQCSRSEPR